MRIRHIIDAWITRGPGCENLCSAGYSAQTINDELFYHGVRVATRDPTTGLIRYFNTCKAARVTSYRPNVTPFWRGVSPIDEPDTYHYGTLRFKVVVPIFIGSQIHLPKPGLIPCYDFDTPLSVAGSRAYWAEEWKEFLFRGSWKNSRNFRLWKLTRYQLAAELAHRQVCDAFGEPFESVVPREEFYRVAGIRTLKTKETTNLMDITFL